MDKFGLMHHEADNLLDNELIRGKRDSFPSRQEADGFAERRREDGFRTRITDQTGSLVQVGRRSFKVSWWLPGANYS